ncbi:hypothetical protein ACOMHN_010117 [Nucella lapillus]
MKRQDRESSPRGSKRSRSGYGPPDHDMGRDRMSPEYERRSRKFMGGGSREGKPFRDYDDLDSRKHFRDDRMPNQGYGPPMRNSGGVENYRSLCITNIPSKMPDADLKDVLTQAYWKFGEMNVKVTFSGDQRCAYVNYRYPEDAKAAKHKGPIDMFDRPLRVDPVFNRRRSGSPDLNRDHFAFHNRQNSPPAYPPPLPPDMGRSPVGRQGPLSLGGRVPFPPDRDMMFNSPPSMRDEIRRAEKFPYHLDHIDPEFDVKATRTLFVGNLDVSIADLELKTLFEKYGYVEDIDIKRPQKGQGNAYAFIKFADLDCAHRAKVEMSGKYVGKFQCKIGYGKVTPTTCVWVGGLGPWVSRETLDQEFDRFGAIQRIEWPAGKHFAYILYDSIEAAKAACQEMRGFPLGGNDRRLRVDFTDMSHMNNPVFNVGPPPQSYAGPERDFDRAGPWQSPSGNGQVERERRRDDWLGDRPADFRGNRGDFGPNMDSRPRGRGDWADFPAENDRRRRPRSPDMGGGPPFPRRSRSPERRGEFLHERGGREEGRGPSGRGDMEDREGGRREDKSRRDSDLEPVDHIRSLADLAKNLPVAWNGALILKNSAFSARMHVVSGDVTIVDTLMRDPTSTEPPVLRITQRLRLDQPKLEDVGQRITSAGRHGHCILLAMPSSMHNYDDQSGVAQQRPLKNLVSYLKQKEAAGVISLPPNPSSNKNVGVLHAFPPCPFGYKFLIQRSPKLPPEFTAIKDEYLVVVVVMGNN